MLSLFFHKMFYVMQDNLHPDQPDQPSGSHYPDHEDQDNQPQHSHASQYMDCSGGDVDGPDQVRGRHDLVFFESRLKTHLLSQGFNCYFRNPSCFISFMAFQFLLFRCSTVKCVTFLNAVLNKV